MCTYILFKKKLILILLKSIYITNNYYRLQFDLLWAYLVALIIEKVIEISRSVQPEQRKYSFPFY